MVKNKSYTFTEYQLRDILWEFHEDMAREERKMEENPKTANRFSLAIVDVHILYHYILEHEYAWNRSPKKDYISFEVWGTIPDDWKKAKKYIESGDYK